jgi:hypothetical protein
MLDDPGRAIASFALPGGHVALAVLVLFQGYRILDRLTAQEQALAALGKGNLRANLVADAAHEKAERAEEKALEARDLAETALSPKDAPPPSSRRPGNGAASPRHEKRRGLSAPRVGHEAGRRRASAIRRTVT